MSDLKERLLTIKWAIGVAWGINKRVLIFWLSLSLAIAVLPAIALNYNKEIVSILSHFISSGSGTFTDVVPSIIILGLILTLSGLSGRINGDLLYMVMYDYYYLGMQELLMDFVNSVEMKKLLDKELIDEFRAVRGRPGSLTDFISSGCMFVSKITSIISLLTVALQVSVVVFTVSLIYVIAVIFLNSIFTEKTRWDQFKTRDAERRAAYYQQTTLIPGIAKEMRVYDTKNEMMSQWEQAYDKIDDYDKKRESWIELVSFLSGIGFYLFMIGIISYSIYQVSKGKMTVDVFLMLYVLGQNISSLFKSIILSIWEADRGLFFLVRQRNFINTISSIDENSCGEDVIQNVTDVVFQADNISFSYDDKIEVLHNLSFQIKKGETIALVGCNGSGKSTLVKLLIELYKPTKGKLKFFGKNYEEYKKGFINRSIGMFFQNYYLFHATLRENVGFGDLKSLNNEEKIKNALEKGGANKILLKFKDGLDQWLLRNVKKTGANLSGGETQKIAVSRAHMSDKDVLIFDEPAAALDPIAEMEQFRTIKEKVTGRTAILISHRVGFARMADRVFVLDKGRLVEVGTHDELIKQNGIYTDFFLQQAEWYDTEEKEVV